MADRNKKSPQKTVIEVIPRTQSKESNVLDLNASTVIVHEIIDEDVDVRITTKVRRFASASMPFVLALSNLLSPDDLSRLASKVNPNAQGAYILSASVKSTQCNLPDQDFRLAASFTKGALKFVDFVSPGALSAEIKNCVNNGKDPIYSVYLPPSSSFDGMSEAFGSRPLEFPAPVPIIQGNSSVWHDSIKMYAGVSPDSVKNTVVQGKTTSITRGDSLVGFVLKTQIHNAVFTAVYAGEEEEPEFPVDADVVLKAPNSVFTTATKFIGDHAKAIENFAKVEPPKIQLFLVSDTLSQDYEIVDDELVHKGTQKKIHLEETVNLTIRMNLKLVYTHRRKSSTAMFFPAATVWVSDIWPAKSVNKLTGAITKGTKPFLGTVAASERLKKLEAQEVKNREARKRDAFHQSNPEGHDIEKDVDDDAGETSIAYPAPSSSSASSSTFHNPLVDDLL